ncbi:MAG TPA: beta-galactosidase trimerization domain-containing protein [Kiritimatiellia bacterium]|nr:beta-galactosidase trimerization domain-containing protein [Kiritimatiellia bacterium]
MSIILCVALAFVCCARAESPSPAHPDLELGRPVSAEELAAWRLTATNLPHRCTVARLPNGGWTFRLPDGKDFMPVGIEYEPLAYYGKMDWALIERDLVKIRDDGFNTVTVWSMDFNTSAGAGARMTISDMVRLAGLAGHYGLLIQFYLNSDRFIHLFPHARLADGSEHGFDIDYCDPSYREFMRNYARRLAMALYPFENVTTLVVWEEKIGVDVDFGPERATVRALYGSAAGKSAFVDWLTTRHGTTAMLNQRWGTEYASIADAVDKTLRDYLAGVSVDDRRQHDVLEFGEVMLVDFTRDFVQAYKAIDPTMLFQCRNWDLFGPVRALHPEFAFLDSFGLNNYSLGHRGHDINLREEIAKMKLVSGIARTAPYVSNFGFRTPSKDPGTHGVVPNEAVKASMAVDTLALFSFLPEMAGTSYFMYDFIGPEGPWGIVRGPDATPLPIYRAFQATHPMFACRNEEVASTDYATPAKLAVFHGLDAVYELRATTWIEHTALSYDLTDMNVNYEVVTDGCKFDPARQPVIMALFQCYDRKLDPAVTKQLARYCADGGTLIIGNGFGQSDRYLRPQEPMRKLMRTVTGVDVPALQRGAVTVKGPEFPDLKIVDTIFTKVDAAAVEGAEVLLDMDVDGETHPALIRKKYGKGMVYYFLFNPLLQQWWGDKPEEMSRTSLPFMNFLLTQLSIPHDTKFGNRGFDLATGRINLHERPIHHAVFRGVNRIGTGTDEYGEDAENYSGGVFTDDFIEFRGRRFEERGWKVELSGVSTLAACVCSNELMFTALDPVEVSIDKGAWSIRQSVVPYETYRIPAPVLP